MSSFKIERKMQGEMKNQGVFFSMLKAILFAYLFTSITFIIYGVLLTYTEMTEKNIQLVVMITTVISVIIAGFITAKSLSSKGLIFGMLAGVLYAVVSLMINFCVAPMISLTGKTLITLILSIFGGGLGGIIGINTKK